MAVYRSLLFVPGDRPDRFAKAAASGADAIIIDWEDAVQPDARAEARRATLQWIAESARDAAAAVGVRMNSLRTVDGCADVVVLAAELQTLRQSLAFLAVPKVETAADAAIVSEALGQALPLLAVVETPDGVAHAAAVAAAAPAGVLFGGADYSASLSADLSDWNAMLFARASVVNAAAAAGVAAYDVPYLDVKDEDGLRTATQRAHAMGFAGRTCIHPAQVSVVNGVFTPSETDVSAAQAIIDALESADGGAVLHQGKLVDRPVILAAQRTLSAAGRGGA